MLKQKQSLIGENFNSFIGQPHIKSRYKFWLNNYEAGHSMPITFLEGPKGHGKTEFAKLVHKEVAEIHKRKGLDHPKFAEVNCARFEKGSDFFEFLLKPLQGLPAVILLDECHKLPEMVQTSLLTPFNPSRNEIVTLNFRGEEYIIDKSKQTFIFATTNPENMIEPLYERLTVVSFKHYKQKELESIARIKTPKNLDIDAEVVTDIANSTRFSPRIISDTIIELEKFSSTLSNPRICIKSWNYYKGIMGILPFGITENEAEMILFLLRKGASSNQVIAAHLKLDQKTVLKKVQSFLLQADLIFIDQSCKRKVTQLGAAVCRLLN